MRNEKLFSQPNRKEVYKNDYIQGTRLDTSCEIQLITSQERVGDYVIGGYYCFLTFVKDEDNAPSIIKQVVNRPLEKGDCILLEKDFFVESNISDEDFETMLYESAGVLVEEHINNHVSYGGHPLYIDSKYEFVSRVSNLLKHDTQVVVNGLLNIEIYKRDFLTATFDSMLNFNRICSSEFNFETKQMDLDITQDVLERYYRNNPNDDSDIIGF